MFWPAMVDPMDRPDRPIYHTSHRNGISPFLGLVKWKLDTDKLLGDHKQVCIDYSNLDVIYTNANIARGY